MLCKFSQPVDVKIDEILELQQGEITPTWRNAGGFSAESMVIVATRKYLQNCAVQRQKNRTCLESMRQQSRGNANWQLLWQMYLLTGGLCEPKSLEANNISCLLCFVCSQISVCRQKQPQSKSGLGATC